MKTVPGANETLDILLRGRVPLIQGRKGYRTSVDSMLLAFFAASLGPVDRVMDLGAGSGLVAILLGRRFVGASLALVELQPGLRDRARRNLVANGLSDRAEIIAHDLADGAPAIAPAPLVVCNPPFFTTAGRIPPADLERRTAHYESTATIAQFAAAASKCVTDDGVCVWIYPRQTSTRLVDGLIDAGLRDVAISHVTHRAGEEPIDRMLVSARIAPSTAVRTAGPVSLHPATGDDSRYSAEIERFVAALGCL